MTSLPYQSGDCVYLDGNSPCGPEFYGYPVYAAASAGVPYTDYDTFGTFIQGLLNATSVAATLESSYGCSDTSTVNVETAVSEFRYQATYMCARYIAVTLYHGYCSLPTLTDNTTLHPYGPTMCIDQCTIANTTYADLILDSNVCPGYGGTNFTVNELRASVYGEYCTSEADLYTANGYCSSGISSSFIDEKSNCGYKTNEMALSLCPSQTDACCKALVAAAATSSSSSKSSGTSKSTSSATSSSTASSSSSGSSGLNSSFLIPVVASVAAFVVIFVLVLVICCYQQRAKRRNNQLAPPQQPGPYPPMTVVNAKSYAGSINSVNSTGPLLNQPNRAYFPNGPQAGSPNSPFGTNSNQYAQNSAPSLSYPDQHIAQTTSPAPAYRPQPVGISSPAVVGGAFAQPAVIARGLDQSPPVVASSSPPYTPYAPNIAVAPVAGQTITSAPTNYSVGGTHSPAVNSGAPATMSYLSAFTAASSLATVDSFVASSPRRSSIQKAPLDMENTAAPSPVQRARAPSPTGSSATSPSITSSSNATSPLVMRVIHPYAPTLEDELELIAGQEVIVLRAFDDGWGLGVTPTNGAQGAFPLVCVTSGFGSETGSYVSESAAGAASDDREKQVRLSAMIQRETSRTR